jgi:hypothetical protein
VGRCGTPARIKKIIKLFADRFSLRRDVANGGNIP